MHARLPPVAGAGVRRKHLAVGPYRSNTLRWALGGAALLLLADLLLVSVLLNEREQALNRGRVTAQTAASIILRRAEGLFDTLDRTLYAIAEVISARDAPPARDDLYIHRLLVRLHATTPSLGWMNVSDTQGMLLTSSLSFPAPQLQLADREYVRVQRADWSQGMYIGLPVITRTLGTQVIPISRRLETDGGRFVGVAAAGLKSEFLQSLVDDPIPSEGLIIGIFRNDGRALACLPSHDACPDAPMNVVERANDEHADSALVSNARLMGTSAGVSALHASQQYDFFVVTDYPTALLLATWHHNLPIYAVLGLGGNLALVFVGLYAWRQVSHRLRAMAELAHSNVVLEDRVQERTEALARMANTDVLTGQPNRRLFMTEGARLLTLARRHHHPLSLMILDADHFKRINDLYGHAAGDAVLRTLASAPSTVLRKSDIFARFGGEEFAVLLPETTHEGALEVGERLLDAFRSTATEHDGEHLHVTVSIGLAELAPGDTDLEALLHRADTALYQAKEAGRDRLVSDRPTNSEE
jgi:diguanylate cyclase (GGDEF)-like protein